MYVALIHIGLTLIKILNITLMKYEHVMDHLESYRYF